MASLKQSIVAISRDKGLDAALLYETVIELADEGLLTAGCLNAAAGILLTELGLPEYFFRNISKDALKRVLRAIASNMQLRDGQFVLRSEVSEARFDVDGGVQARIATPENRDRMEAILNTVMLGHRIEYYFGKEHHYYTYIIAPETCKMLEEMKEGESPFAFNQLSASPAVPESTRARYEAFLMRSRGSIIPLVEVSASAPSGETRIMFKEDFPHSPLPVIRQMLSELGITLNRAYWETYRGETNRTESICSLYLDGTPRKSALETAVVRLRALLAIQSGQLDDLYVGGALTFDEYIFAIAAYAFVHLFIYKDLTTDKDIMDGLSRKELRDALSKRIFDSNRSEYTRKVILDTIRQHPDFVKSLYRLFDRKFNPRHKHPADLRAIARELESYRQRAEIAFVDDRTGYDIFCFMTRIITHVHKTNFYKVEKRSFAFRLDAAMLDPLAFPQSVHGIFFVIGFYATCTHMRAADVARGGVRLIRVTPGNFETELDNMPLLNYALGPVAQRIKHKDIAESGAKGVIVPGVEYPRDGLNAMFDFSEGIMDLVQPCEAVVDYLGRPEMIFFGPDEGTASFMDAVALRARQRGYRHWRTMTTGKAIGIPHDTYGLTADRQVFGLLPQGEKGTELQLGGQSLLVTTEIEEIYDRIGDRIDASGMTTIGVMACLRTVLRHAGLDESSVRLMMTGGPDGDLGANQIQSFKGRICLITDGGSVLFDPEGLDRKELMKLALARHTHPRLNSMAYPTSRLSPRGFRVPRVSGRFQLPDGSVIEDGAFFHRSFLTNPSVRKYVEGANLQVFVPCGGFKDTINAENVRSFIEIFKELRIIVEGANVFFDDTARELIATQTSILHIKDSSANKGGVTSSSIAEVLSAFLLGDNYEKVLVRNRKAKAEIIREVFDLVTQNAVAETTMLLALHDKTRTPLYKLSVQTSEQIFALQDRLYARMDLLLKNERIVTAVLKAYIPAAFLKRVGMPKILRIFGNPELRPYRDAILTKKIAAMALYRYAADWDNFLKRLEADFLGTIQETVLSAAGKNG